MEDFKIPLSVATASVGFGTRQPLAQKLEAISRAGYDGIELAFPDLLAFAHEWIGRTLDLAAEEDRHRLLEAAAQVRALCRRSGLTIVMLQPLTHFEGWPENSRERQHAMERARLWILIMTAVGTNMLQLGSSDSPHISADKQRLADDLGQLADMLGAHGYYLCYENWCWATRCATWSSAWEIVNMAHRPNLGLCLDTFHTAGGEWGDPTTGSGMIESASQNEVHRRYEKSLRDLTAQVPKEKIYILQVSDAYRPDVPMARSASAAGVPPPRAQWSHGYRPMPYDGGYLPIVAMARAVLNTGYRGWFSLEVFDGGETGKGKQADMDYFAQKSIGSLRGFLQEAGASL